MSPGKTPRDVCRRRSAGVALALWLAPTLASANGWVDVPLDRLHERLGPAAAKASLTSRGLEIEVDGPTRLVLPFAAQELELSVQGDGGPLLLIWAVQVGSQPTPWGFPWRYRTVTGGATALRLDLRTVAGWTPEARPALVFDGAGRVLVRSMRARPPRGGFAEARRAYDRARFWAPQSVDPTLINTFAPVLWSESRGGWLADRVALLGLAAFAIALALARARTGRWQAGRALAAAAVLALALWNGHFLVRFLPMAKLSFTPDPEDRIRENHYYLPAFGALAALARATLRPDERVGAVGSPQGWFAPQTLCFNLAPRRCAIVRPGERVHHGIGGVGTLRDDELDAIVSYHGGPPPEGFDVVASIGPRAYVARRR